MTGMEGWQPGGRRWKSVWFEDRWEPWISFGQTIGKGAPGDSLTLWDMG